MPTPNFVNALPGQKFFILVGDGGSPETFNFFCIGTTLDSKHDSEIEDGAVLDCSDPTAMAQRVSAVKMLTWDITCSGLADPSKLPYQRLRTAYRSGASINIQLKHDLTGANGGETEQGAFLVKSWQENKADNGLVKVSFDLHGTGAPIVTPNA